MSEAKTQTLWLSVAVTYGYVALWISLSASVIMYNKWVLAYYGFAYPVALTLWHMVFCSALSFTIVKLGYVDSISMSRETYVKSILPIAVLYAGTLWLGNAAYLYLSVSFIQMLKALMPVAVFLVGCVFGTEAFKPLTLANMLVVSLGVAVASWGELNFVVVGVVLQMLSICTESTRLTLVQILLQRRGLKLNPITTLYYLAPACAAVLLIPFAFVEAPKLLNDPDVRFGPFVMITNAGAAFGLNMAVFLLIGKTSALTMNIGGVVKDWLLIALSWAVFRAPVSMLNLVGYAIAFLAVCWYNLQKLAAMRAAIEKPQPIDLDQEGLLNQRESSAAVELGVDASRKD